MGNLVFWDGHATSIEGREAEESQEFYLPDGRLHTSPNIHWSICP